jgi:hypothetical protein
MQLPQFFHITKQKYIFKRCALLQLLVYSISSMVLPLWQVYLADSNMSKLSSIAKKNFACIHMHVYIYTSLLNIIFGPHLISQNNVGNPQWHINTPFDSHSLDPVESISWLCQARCHTPFGCLQMYWWRRGGGVKSLLAQAKPVM